MKRTVTDLHCVTVRDGHRQNCLKCMEAEAKQPERGTTTAGDLEEEGYDIVHLYKFSFMYILVQGHQQAATTSRKLYSCQERTINIDTLRQSTIS